VGCWQRQAGVSAPAQPAQLNTESRSRRWRLRLKRYHVCLSPDRGHTVRQGTLSPNYCPLVQKANAVNLIKSLLCQVATLHRSHDCRLWGLWNCTRCAKLMCRQQRPGAPSESRAIHLNKQHTPPAAQRPTAAVAARHLPAACSAAACALWRRSRRGTPAAAPDNFGFQSHQTRTGRLAR